MTSQTTACKQRSTGRYGCCSGRRARAHTEIDALLDPQFFEFGASGRRLSRDDIIATLPAEVGASIGAHDVAAVQVAGGVVLVTYVSDQGDRRCNRSSIWRLTPAGWRCYFHQGTLIPDEG